MAPKTKKITTTVELPVLVYWDEADKVWVAQSLLTSTTAVNVNEGTALSEVCSLVRSEILAALEMAKGNVPEALKLIVCPAPADLLRVYFTGAKESDPVIECEPIKFDATATAAEKRRSRLHALPPLRFAPREAIALA